LNTYAEKISQYAEQRFKRSDISIITNARWVFLFACLDIILMVRVAEVSEDTVKITIKNPKDKSAEAHAIEIPAGFVLWSTGIGTSHLPLNGQKLINSNATPHQTSR
jgi:NADH dehydrogenase FAD-containing subunit